MGSMMNVYSSSVMAAEAEAEAAAMSKARSDSVYDSSGTMMANVYQGVRKPSKWMRVSRPKLQFSTDVIIRVHKTTICGTDLHILGGNVPQTKAGIILGHEGIGVIVEAGSAVRKYRVGDRILISCITACGRCSSCSKKEHAHCTDGGWQFGTLINGMQAEYCRVPHADFTAYSLPNEIPLGSPKEDAYVMASDVLPTCYEIGLRGGDFPKSKTSSVAVVGAGPLGLATVLCAATDMEEGARIFAVDLAPARLERAKLLGATDLINNSKGDCVEQIMKATNGKGVDFVVECIGLPIGWHICQDLVAIGGEISILGVHGKPGQFSLERLWDRNVSIHTGMVHGYTIPSFLDKIRSGKMAADKLISHPFSLNDVEEAYTFFKQAARTGSLKVLITNDVATDEVSESDTTVDEEEPLPVLAQ